MIDLDDGVVTLMSIGSDLSAEPRQSSAVTQKPSEPAPRNRAGTALSSVPCLQAVLESEGVQIDTVDHLRYGGTRTLRIKF